MYQCVVWSPEIGQRTLLLPMLYEVIICPAQVCLAGSMQTDDCAADIHSCWTHSEGQQHFSACKDTFRGYVCKCPEGVPAADPLAQH